MAYRNTEVAEAIEKMNKKKLPERKFIEICASGIDQDQTSCMMPTIRYRLR